MGNVRTPGSTLGLRLRDLLTKDAATRCAERENEAARALVRLVPVAPARLLSGSGRSLVLGAPVHVREEALAGAALESLARGVPVVVVSEGVADLARALGRVGAGPVEVLDARSRRYEPLAGRSARDAAEVMEGALTLVRDGGTEAGPYLGALAQVLDRKGLPVSVRMMDGCPQARMHEVIDRLEQSGRVDAAEAADLRARLDVSPACRAAVQGFFREAVAEGSLLAGAGTVSSACSVIDVGRRGGAVLLDVSSGYNAAVCSLVFSEVGFCLRRSARLTVIVRARSMSRWEELGELLRCAPSARWVVSCDEALEFFPSGEQLLRWAASADRVVAFSQGHASSEAVSELLGEYEKVDLSVSEVREGSLGGLFGGWPDARSVTRSPRRERVVRPEEVRSLAPGEFLVLERGEPSVGEGSVA